MMFAPKLNQINQIFGSSRAPFRSRFQGLCCCCGKAVGKCFSPEIRFLLPDPAVGVVPKQIPACCCCLLQENGFSWSPGQFPPSLSVRGCSVLQKLRLISPDNLNIRHEAEGMSWPVPPLALEVVSKL